MSHISYMIYFFRVSEYKSLIFRKNYLIIVLKKAMKPKNAIKILIAMRLSNYQIIKFLLFFYKRKSCKAFADFAEIYHFVILYPYP